MHISAWETGSRSFGSFSKTADGKSVSSDQDLEDSLWSGASVLRAAAESVHAMVEELGMPPNRIVWGKDFESHVAFAEESTATLRRLYGRQEGAEEDVGSFTDDGCRSAACSFVGVGGSGKWDARSVRLSIDALGRKHSSAELKGDCSP